LDKIGIESEVIGKIEYKWQNLIIVRWQSVTDTVTCWTYTCMEMPSGKTHTQNCLVLRNAYYG